MAKLKKGDKVNRIEDREEVSAVVAKVLEDGYYLITYDEGGEGIWPEDALEKA